MSLPVNICEFPLQDTHLCYLTILFSAYNDQGTLIHWNVFLSDLEQLLLMSYYMEALHNKILWDTLPKLSISVTTVNVVPIKFLKILPDITDTSVLECVELHLLWASNKQNLCAWKQKMQSVCLSLVTPRQNLYRQDWFCEHLPINPRFLFK